MIPMPKAELSGFSMFRDGLAALCVNDNEPTEGAKIFTLFHEYCHLLLRRTGISDENNSNKVERFCNAFAASFLVPRLPLRESVKEPDTGPREFSGTKVKKLAMRFRVSNSCMALRLEKTGLAPRGFFARHTGSWDLPVEPPQPRTGKVQPSQIKIRMKRIGHLHAATVMRAVDNKAINALDAAGLIGLRPATFPKIKVALE